MPPPIGTHFGKTDLERYGLFAEMGYLHGKGYTVPVVVPQIRDPKNRQMFPGHPKWKTGLQDCYFDQKYKRLFIGEALTNVFKRELKQRNESNKLNRGKFRPSSFTHLHATPGDYFGCFTGKIKAFDPRPKPKAPEGKADKAKKPNIFKPPNPGKKGGFGYANIAFDKYPKYIPTAYDPKPKTDDKGKDKASKPNVWKPPQPGGYFDNRPFYRVVYKRTYPAKWGRGVFKPNNPAKSLGGCMAGCFSKWPKYIATRYIDPWKVSSYKKGKQDGKPDKEEKVTQFYPPVRNKTYPTPSVMYGKAFTATNHKTWRKMEPVTYTREFI